MQHPSLSFVDVLTTLLVLWASWRIVQFDYSGIDHLLNGLGSADFLAGVVIVLATLELARRSVGPVMCAIGLVFILYAAFGNVLAELGNLFADAASGRRRRLPPTCTQPRFWLRSSSAPSSSCATRS